MRTGGSVVLLPVLVLAVVELAVRVDLVPAPRVQLGASTTRRVLCAGDSYTYGLGVRAEEAFPEQLQQLLDAAFPSVYSVLNLGVPGMTCSEVRNRLPAQIESLQPDMVIVWCGADVAASEGVTARSRPSSLEALAGRLRTYQLVRAWRAQLMRAWRGGSTQEADAAGMPVGDRMRHDLDGWLATSHTVDWGDDAKLYYPPPEPGVDVLAERRAFKLYDNMTAFAASKAVRLALLTYPLDLPAFRAANHALRLPSMLTVVDSGRSLDRLPPSEREWTSSGHPGPAMYREVARDVADIVLTRIPPHRPAARSRGRDAVSTPSADGPRL